MGLPTAKEGIDSLKRLLLLLVTIVLPNNVDRYILNIAYRNIIVSLSVVQIVSPIKPLACLIA